MEFTRENTLLHKLAIIDGVGKSGKILLLTILSCFDGVEKQQYNPILEYIAYADKYQKITKDIAISILKTDMDTALYNNMIGRNINTRLSDDTSLYRYHSPEKYLKRSLDVAGSVISQHVQEERPIYLCWAHDLIHKSDIIFEAYGEKLEYFYINRRPIDIITDWCRGYDFSARMAKDPTEMQFCIKHKNSVVPAIALGWEEEYLICNPIERTIKLIYTFMFNNYQGLLNKKENNNLHVINFEDLVTFPQAIIEKTQTIFKRESLPILKKVLRQENCPRILNENDYTEKKFTLIKQISPYYIQLLDEMEEIYNSTKRLIGYSLPTKNIASQIN